MSWGQEASALCVEDRSRASGRRRARRRRASPPVQPCALLRDCEDLAGTLARALFAAYLRTSVRALENREQGRAKPNAQAALLINLVKQYPDTVQRLATI